MPDDAQGAAFEWLDGHGVPWRIELPPERIVLHGAVGSMELPASEWRRDIFIAIHGDGFIVRFERFDSSIGFVLRAEQAAPLLAHLGVPLERPSRLLPHACHGHHVATVRPSSNRFRRYFYKKLHFRFLFPQIVYQ